MIIFNKVTKKFKDGTVILDDISFTIDKGEFVFLIGPSGAGKTTISRLLLREISPTKGRIFVDNEEIVKIKEKKIPQLRRKIGTAFQDYKLFWDRTIFENISLPLEIAHKRKEDNKEKVNKILSLVSLEGKEEFFPLQLSGGELQRVVIARALVAGPKILFADEPTGNLDQDTAWEIIDLLKRINEKGTTVVVSTHNVGIVDSFPKRVIRLEKGKIKKEEEKGKKSKSDKKSATPAPVGAGQALKKQKPLKTLKKKTKKKVKTSPKSRNSLVGAQRAAPELEKENLRGEGKNKDE